LILIDLLIIGLHGPFKVLQIISSRGHARLARVSFPATFAR
jgi:hypothetical protein